MKCPDCEENVEEIYNMQEWMEFDMENGNLDTRDYFAMDDYAQEHYDEAFCKECYEKRKKELLENMF